MELKPSPRCFLLSGVLILAGLYLLCLRAYYVGFFNDDAFYVIGARSLLRGGFRELNAPGTPALVNFLPGYPALLALWSLIAGKSLLAAQLLSVALTILGLVLFWLCFSVELPAAAAAACVLAAGFNPLSASVSGTVLSDIPFFTATIGAFLAARAAWPSQRPRTWAGVGAFMGAAFLIRPTGAALALALFLSLAAERRWKEAAWSAAGCALVAAPWLARNALISGVALSHGAELAAPFKAGTALSDLAGRIWRNAGYYGSELFWRTLYRWPQFPGLGLLKGFTSVLCVVALAAGLRAWGWRGWRKFFFVYFVIYAGLHLELHLCSGRYIFTALPMVLPMLFLGFEELGRRLGLGSKALWTACVLSLALSAAPVANIVAASLWRHTALNTPPRKTLAWIREQTRAEDVFAAELDGRLHLISGRRTVRLRKIFDPVQFGGWLRGAGAGYVLVAPADYFMTTMSGSTMHDPMPLDRLARLLGDAKSFARVFQDEQEGIAIYRVL
ncbi:MAG TPA: hypothetical protein DEB40_09580 [Elusimicrobia bacterium]|nr:hypothetical protein [Elusimicrobiota bacterium]HBT61979.1 hypothetical protein [Elusimicrobiota bacterium]